MVVYHDAAIGGHNKTSVRSTDSFAWFNVLRPCAKSASAFAESERVAAIAAACGYYTILGSFFNILTAAGVMGAEHRDSCSMSRPGIAP